MSNEQQRINVRADEIEEVENPFDQQDPFSKSWSELKAYSGFNKNFSRNTTRADNAALKKTINTASAPYLDSAKAVPSGDDAESKQINPGTVYRNGYGLFDVVNPPYNLYELASFYDTAFANHAAIDAKVSNAVGLGYKFEETKSTMLQLEANTDTASVDRARKRIEKAKIELGEWLENLNDDDSFGKTMEKFYTDVEATGNGYLEVGRDVEGNIGYLGHIPAVTMRVRRLKDGFLQLIGNRVVYFRNFGADNANPVTNDTNPNEIIHYKEYSPLNTFYGIPDIISSLGALIGDQLASQYNIDFFQNKAVPRYVIVLKGAQMSGESEDKMFNFLKTSLKGQNHRTLYIPLPGDTLENKVTFEMIPLENGIQDGSFKEYRKQNRDDIFAAHQMPPSKIGVSDSGLAATLSQDRNFKEQIARPSQKNLEKVVGKVIKEQTDVLVLKFEELTLTDEIAQSQILERYVKNQILVPNEARTILGYGQRKGGDTPLILNPKDASDAKGVGSKTRDSERTNNNSDSTSTVAGRNPKGEGRSSQ
jgi:PBSX family phage portal protein